MKKCLRVAITAIMICSLILPGCGDSAGKTVDSNPVDQSADISEAEQVDSGKEEIKKEEVKEEEAVEGKVEQEENENEESSGDANEAPTEDTENESKSSAVDLSSFAEAFEKGMVENGSYFVRLGNKVYFRKISMDSMDAGAEFGHFLNSESSNVESPLICFDLESGKWEEIGNIMGTGELYACPEGFYIGDMDPESPDADITWFYNPATGDQSQYCYGVPQGVSKSGKLLAVEQHQSARSCFPTVLVKNGEEIVSLGDEDNYYIYCGFAGEDLILIQRKGWGGETDEEWFVCSVNENGEVTTLGSMGTFDYSYPELQQFRTIDGTVYLVFGFYEGSGHFLSNWTTYKAVPGKTESLQEVNDGKDDYYVEEGYEEMVPQLCVDTGDYIFYSVYTPFDAHMGIGDNSNNMYYYDESYDDCLLLRDFIKNDYGEKCQIIQDLTTFPEYVFVIYADAEQDEEYSIGWRTGYRMTGLHICAIPFGYGQYDEVSAAEGIIYFD